MQRHIIHKHLSTPVIALFFCTLFISNAGIAFPPKWGTEFTFTNNTLREGMRKHRAKTNNGINISSYPENEAKLEEIYKKIKEQCSSCQFEETTDKHGRSIKVTNADGFWVAFGLDQSVIEVQTKPSTLDELTEQEQWIQKHVFALTKELGLEPDKDHGGGHLTLDNETAFGDDSKLYRNFHADFSNHPAMSRGIMGHADIRNAPALNILPMRQQEAYKKALATFDEKYLDYVNQLNEALKQNPLDINEIKRALQKKPDLFDFIREVERDVYTWSPGHDPDDMGALHRYYQALRLKVDRTEIRPPDAQRSLREMIVQGRLFEQRISHLKEKKGLIPYTATPEPLSSKDVSWNERNWQFHSYASGDQSLMEAGRGFGLKMEQGEKSYLSFTHNEAIDLEISNYRKLQTELLKRVKEGSASSQDILIYTKITADLPFQEQQEHYEQMKSSINNLGNSGLAEELKNTLEQEKLRLYSKPKQTSKIQTSRSALDHAKDVVCKILFSKFFTFTTLGAGSSILFETNSPEDLQQKQYH